MKSAWLVALALVALAHASSISHDTACVSPPEVKEHVLNDHQGGHLTLRNVCLEGDAIVLHDQQYEEHRDSGVGGGLPHYDTHRWDEFHKHAHHKPHPLRPTFGSECRHPHPMKFRYPSALEVKRAKHFSKCTVPFLIFAHWIHTFAEFFTRGPAHMHRLQVERGGMDKNVSLVLASCGSIPLQRHHKLLLQPFTNYQVTSWHAFASPASPRSPSNSTAEGTHVRCFEKLVILGLDHANWAGTYNAAQYVLEHYKKQKVLPDFKLFKSGPEVLKLLFEYRSPDGLLHSSHGGTVPKVTPYPASHPDVQYAQINGRVAVNDTLKARPVYPGVRQILNLQEVLDECNAHNWTQALNGTRWRGVECRAYTFGEELYEGMAVAQQADMFMSLHGSGEMNSMFMRKGTIKVQLRSKEFGTVHRFMSNGFWPLVCHQNRFPYQCFFVNFDEEDTWEPGVIERLGIYDVGPNPTARDRHLWLRLKHLEHVLAEILPLQDNMPEYQRLWDLNNMAITFNQNKTVTHFQQFG